MLKSKFLFLADILTQMLLIIGGATAIFGFFVVATTFQPFIQVLLVLLTVALVLAFRPVHSRS